MDGNTPEREEGLGSRLLQQLMKQMAKAWSRGAQRCREVKMFEIRWEWRSAGSGERFSGHQREEPRMVLSFLPKGRCSPKVRGTGPAGVCVEGRGGGGQDTD